MEREDQFLYLFPVCCVADDLACRDPFQGGEVYYEQNGFQILWYYDNRAKGCRYPVVGATDGHSSVPSNAKAYICSTMVFAAKNERGS